MSTKPTNPEQRRWGRIPDAIKHSGLGRSYLYILAANNPGLFCKHGAATVVDIQMLDAILDAAPWRPNCAKRAERENSRTQPRCSRPLVGMRT